MPHYSFPPVPLKEIPLSKYPKDFTFILNDQHYQTNRFIADLLSPNIRRYSFSDDTINHFEITIKDNENAQNFQIGDHCIEYFDNLVQSILTNTTLQINDQNSQFYFQLFFQLGNIDESLKFVSSFDLEITLENVFQRIDALKLFYLKASYGTSNDGDITVSAINPLKNELDFIAQHFYEVDHDQLQNLEDYLLEYIISHEDLHLENEDSLLYFLMKISESRPSMSNLFEYVEFCNLSYEAIQLFIVTFSLENLNQSIWDQICKRLIQNVINTPTTHKYISNHCSQSAKVRKFSPKKSSYFDGIMRYLTKQTGGNIHTNGTIEITTNSNYKVNAQNIVDFGSSNYFFAPKSSNAIIFDFKDRRVQLSHYSLQSSNNFYMMNWFLETSDDLKQWTVIDKKINCTDLIAPRSSSTYSVHHHVFSRYVRYRHEGPSLSDGYETDVGLAIQNIEFYGQLRDSQTTSTHFVWSTNNDWATGTFADLFGSA